MKGNWGQSHFPWPEIQMVRIVTILLISVSTLIPFAAVIQVALQRHFA
jgi:hypothetical protein